MVFQSYALYPTMTVRENMAFGLRMAKVPASDINERVTWAAGLLRLGDYLDRKPGQLSGGQRQRVAIGRAIVRRAKVYLFDEPLSNLDAKLRAEMRLEIKRLHQQLGATMIYVTHDQIEAMSMATRVALMRGGEVEQFAPPSEIYNRPASRYVAEFVGSPQINILNATLLGAGAQIRLDSGSSVLDVPPGRIATRNGNDAERSVHLGLRPEHLGFSAATGMPVLMPQARVDVVEFTGADAMVWVQSPEGRVCARVAASAAPAMGRTVAVYADSSAVSLFDRESGRRV
jgi:multiple sugar transport system ATP-binding protein